MIRPLTVIITWILISCGHALGQGSVVAHGGGADWDLESHREMVRWMVEQAWPEGSDHAAPVKVVILGAVPREPSDPDAAADAFRREGAEATALVITDENADSPEMAAAINAARIVWIRGGNQWRYVNWWKNTATERAIRAVFEAGGVVGGTSAGCAILGEVSYDARNGSLRPEQALTDAHHENLTLTQGFLNVVPGVLFDSHFTERGRIGRLPVMMARAKVDFGKDVLGVGVDEGTAVLISPGAAGARIIGSGGVTVLSLSARSRIEVEAGGAPLVTDVRFDYLFPGCEYAIPEGQLLAYPGKREQRTAQPTESQPPHVAPVRNAFKHFEAFWEREGGTREGMPKVLEFLRTKRTAAATLLDASASINIDGADSRIGRSGDAPASAAIVLCGGRFATEQFRGRTLPQHLILGAVLHVLPEGWGAEPEFGYACPPAPDQDP